MARRITKKELESPLHFGSTNLIIDRVYIEISPNNRAKCRSCLKLITKGSLRMVLWGKFPYHFKGVRCYKEYKYYTCWSCCESSLNLSVTTLQMVRREVKKWRRNNGEKIKEFEDKNVALEVAGSL